MAKQNAISDDNGFKTIIGESDTIPGETRRLKVGDDGAAFAKLSGSSALKGAVQNVTTAGTRVQFPSYACREVTVIAKKGNTGNIYVGGSDVSATVYGVTLAANESFTFSIANTNLIYIDAAVSGEGVSYVAI